MARAREITFSAFVLQDGVVEKALERAARRGATVRVRLEGFEGKPRPLHAVNANAAGRLEHFGVDARLVHTSSTDRPALHLKAAVCDGVAFLDDCNWRRSGDTILRDTTRAHVRAIKRVALRETGTGRCSLPLDKASALRSESDLLMRARRGDRIDVETETISSQSPIYAALEKLAERGVRCRLLVYSREIKPAERHALFLLAGHGVDIRLSEFTEKLATLDSARAWIGSANGTSGFYNSDCTDWGVQTGDSRLVRTAQAHFSAHWRRARAPELRA